MVGTVPSEPPACKFLQTDSGQKAWQRCRACIPVLPNSRDSWNQVGGARDAAQVPGHPHDRERSSPKAGRDPGPGPISASPNLSFKSFRLETASLLELTAGWRLQPHSPAHQHQLLDTQTLQPAMSGTHPIHHRPTVDQAAWIHITNPKT